MSLVVDTPPFGEWLQRERGKRGWSQSDLARRAGLHRQIINKTENGVSKPALETILALADALDISPIKMLRIAGALPPGPENDVRLEDWEHLLDQLPPETQDELYEIGQLMVERRRRAEEKAAAAKRRNPRTSP